MKKHWRRQFLLGSLGIVALTIITVALLDPYRLLSTRQWVAMLTSGGSRSHHATIAIRRTPKEKLLPLLREWIAITNTADIQPENSHSRFAIMPRLSPERRREAAYHAVAAIGPEGKPLLPELTAVVLGPDAPAIFDATFALMAIGSEGHSVIAKVTSTNSAKAQIAKAAAIETLREPAVVAVQQNWAAQTAEQINLIRCIFNLKCLKEKIHQSSPIRSGEERRRPRARIPKPLPASLPPQLDE